MDVLVLLRMLDFFCERLLEVLQLRCEQVGGSNKWVAVGLRLLLLSPWVPAVVHRAYCCLASSCLELGTFHGAAQRCRSEKGASCSVSLLPTEHPVQCTGDAG